MSFTEHCNEIFIKLSAITTSRINVDNHLLIIHTKRDSYWKQGLYLKCWPTRFSGILRGPYPWPAHRSRRWNELKAPHRPFQPRPNRPVEQIDSYFRQLYLWRKSAGKGVPLIPKVRHGQDRLCLSWHWKIYHMKEQAERTDASAEHIQKRQNSWMCCSNSKQTFGTALSTSCSTTFRQDANIRRSTVRWRCTTTPATNPYSTKVRGEDRPHHHHALFCHGRRCSTVPVVFSCPSISRPSHQRFFPVRLPKRSSATCQNVDFIAADLKTNTRALKDWTNYTADWRQNSLQPLPISRCAALEIHTNTLLPLLRI